MFSCIRWPAEWTLRRNCRVKSLTFTSVNPLSPPIIVFSAEKLVYKESIRRQISVENAHRTHTSQSRATSTFLEVREEIPGPFKPHLETNCQLINTNIGRIGGYENSEISLSDMTLVTEEAYSPELVDFM